MGDKGRRRLEKLIPQVLKEVGGGGRSEIVLGRIIDLIKSIGGRISYFALLLENPMVLTHLIQLAGASPWIASFLAQHPVLLDELLDPRTLYIPPETGQRPGTTLAVYAIFSRRHPGEDRRRRLQRILI